MKDIKLKAFIKPKYTDNIETYENFEYGGFYVGEGTNYVIKSIDLNRKTITIYTPSIHDIIPYYAFGYITTQEFEFDEVEVIDFEIHKTEYTIDELTYMDEKSQADCKKQNNQ